MKTEVDNVKSIILDLDGTILDSNMIKEDAFKRVFSKYGVEVAVSAAKYHRENLGLNRLIKFKYIIENYTNVKFSEELGDNLSVEFSDIVLNSMIECDFIKNAEYFLKKHYKKYLLFVSSAMPDLELIEIITRRGLSKFLREYKGYPFGKSDFVSMVLKKYELERNDVIFVGDAQSDYDAANKNKIGFILVGSVAIKGEPIKRINDFKQLESFLNGDINGK